MEQICRVRKGSFAWVGRVSSVLPFRPRSKGVVSFALIREESTSPLFIPIIRCHPYLADKFFKEAKKNTEIKCHIHIYRAMDT